jgi:predicted nucleic acid-binding protein
VHLIDANILAYLLIEGERSDDARALLRKDTDWHSERFVFIELTNVLVTYLRSGSLRFLDCEIAMERAEALIGNNLHVTPDLEVIRTAQEFRISAYDARYITLAREFGVPLITEDAKLRRAVPSLTVSMKEALE